MQQAWRDGSWDPTLRVLRLGDIPHLQVQGKPAVSLLRLRQGTPARLGRVSIPASEIEQFVVEQIREMGSDPELIQEVTAKACEQASAEIVKLQQEHQTLLKQIRTDWEQIETLAVSCDTTKRVSAFADLNQRQEIAKGRLDEIEAEFESLASEQIDTAEVTAAFSNFHELWAQLRPNEQARLLALLVEQVDHDGRHGNVSITFHPTGIRTLMQESVDLCEVAV